MLDCRLLQSRAVSPTLPVGYSPGANTSLSLAMLLALFAHRTSRSDTRLQFAQLRDPRAITVSAYFTLAKYSPRALKGMTVDEYFIANLPLTCQWIALRHIVFEGLMARNSSIFWFEDTTEDPKGWHFQWMSFAGVQLPATVVDGIAQAAVNETRGFINQHVGGLAPSVDRTWKDEVTDDVVDGADAVLRELLPPALLARLGIIG